MANFGIIPTARTRVQYSSTSSIILYMRATPRGWVVYTAIPKHVQKSSPHFGAERGEVNAVKFRELNIFCGNQNLKRALTRDVRSNTLKMKGTYYP